MSLVKYIDRLKRMDELIRKRATGSPDSFAAKLNISRSLLMFHLAELKEIGAQIKYDYLKQSYVYCNGCHLYFEFRLQSEELNKIKGGGLSTLFESLLDGPM